MRWLKNYQDHLKENIDLLSDPFWKEEIDSIAKDLSASNLQKYFDDYLTEMPPGVQAAIEKDGWEWMPDATTNFWVIYTKGFSEVYDESDPFIKIIVELDPNKNEIHSYAEFWSDSAAWHPSHKIKLEKSKIKGINYTIANPKTYAAKTSALIISVAKKSLQELRQIVAEMGPIKNVDKIQSSMKSNSDNWLLKVLYNNELSLFPGTPEQFHQLFKFPISTFNRIQRSNDLFGED